jgi:hypothetical protein
MGGSGGGGGYYDGGSGGAGSGGGGTGGGGIGGGPPGGDPCNLVIDATIHAPNTDFTDTLTIGTFLDVRLGGPSGRTIEVYTSSGNRVGSLIGITQLGQLIECIQNGTEYTAEVRRIHSGVFGVRVTRST